MLTAVDKGYWEPSADALVDLRSVHAELAPAVEAETRAVMQRASEVGAISRPVAPDAAPGSAAIANVPTMVPANATSSLFARRAGNFPGQPRTVSVVLNINSRARSPAIP